MGYSQSWLAVKGKTRAVVVEALGLQGTAVCEEFPESPIVGAELPGGWYLVVANESGHPLMHEAVVKRLSVGCEIVTGDVEEHVMVSISEDWKDGRLMWRVIHDAQRDLEHLEAQGELPARFESIRDELRSQLQASGGRDSDVDYLFDVPVELAKALTGYRHDEDVAGLQGEPFEVLAELSPARLEKPSLWKKLFGADTAR